MTTVRELWDSFAEKVLDATHPPEQYTEMRRAFYAGCWGMMMEMVRITDSVTDNEAGEAAGAVMMERLERELKQFHTDVAAGRT